MAKMIAKAVNGQEFLYSRNTAHKVSERSADAICKVLNDCKWKLNGGEVWHVFDCGWYELEYTAAAFQSFTIRNGLIKEKRYA